MPARNALAAGTAGLHHWRQNAAAPHTTRVRPLRMLPEPCPLLACIGATLAETVCKAPQCRLAGCRTRVFAAPLAQGLQAWSQAIITLQAVLMASVPKWRMQLTGKLL